MVLNTVKTLLNDRLGGQVKKQAAKSAVWDSFYRLHDRERARVPDDIALKGFKVYSQADEDGLIEAIFNCVGSGSTYLEIGVETGIECNTHLLGLKGWRGGWIDGNPDACKTVVSALGQDAFAGTFRISEGFVHAHNITTYYRDHCEFLNVQDVDFFSLDIDGNDSFVIDQMLTDGAKPSIICLEYNGKFPPSLNVGVRNMPERSWDRDDYFGASLSKLCEIMVRHQYHLITCNLTGANCFFVCEELAHLFPRRRADEVWRPLRFDLTPLPAGHRPTLKFLRDVLQSKTEQI